MVDIPNELEGLINRLSGITFGIPHQDDDGSEHPFESRNIHPEISNVSKILFDSGHYKYATLQACILIDNIVKARSRIEDTGFNLMMNALNEDSPSIALNNLDNSSEKSEQKGFRHIFAGVAAGIRNPRAHEANYPETMEECLDHLSLASLLMRKIDNAP